MLSMVDLKVRIEDKECVSIPPTTLTIGLDKNYVDNCCFPYKENKA
jgi:hypothetical protein